MTSSNGNIFRVTGSLCGEFTGHRWITVTKASDAELWYGSGHGTVAVLLPGFAINWTIFSLICAWINGWINNREAGNLRCHGAHYDVTVLNSFISRSRLSTVESVLRMPISNWLLTKTTITLKRVSICLRDNHVNSTTQHGDVTKWKPFPRYWPFVLRITLTPYMVLPLFATRFADYAGGIRASFIQPRRF